MIKCIPQIKKHYSENEYVLWSDLASAHYGRKAIAYLESKKIKFVAKVDNPPNVPESRPIEDFWGILKCVSTRRLGCQVIVAATA